MTDGDFKGLIFLSHRRVFYIWIKGAINLFWQMKLGSTTLSLLPSPFLLRSHLERKKKPDEEIMMNHSSCGTAQIRHNLHFHVIIRLSLCFQITFRATLNLSLQTPAWGESNHENGNRSGSFSGPWMASILQHPRSERALWWLYHIALVHSRPTVWNGLICSTWSRLSTGT